jgi:hypothetical protein
VDECKANESERTNGKDGNTWINKRTMNQNIKYGHYKTGTKKGNDIIKERKLDFFWTWDRKQNSYR